MKEIFKKCLSHEYLEVNKDGIVRFIDTKIVVPSSTNHSMSLNGPIIYFRLDGKTRQIGLRGLVYEAWVVNRRLKKGEFVSVKNGDEDDCRADNLERARNKKRSPYYNEGREPYSCWMGLNEVYC